MGFGGEKGRPHYYFKDYIERGLPINQWVILVAVHYKRSIVLGCFLGCKDMTLKRTPNGNPFYYELYILYRYVTMHEQFLF